MRWTPNSSNLVISSTTNHSLPPYPVSFLFFSFLSSPTHHLYSSLIPHPTKNLQYPIPMATLSPPTFTAAAVTTPTRSTTPKVTYIKGLNSFNGLKSHNTIASLNTHVSTEQQFANFVCSLKKPSSGGGAMTATCNAVGEIFKIAAIMNGITLVGVAIGFVLLRIEASVEESE